MHVSMSSNRVLLIPLLVLLQLMVSTGIMPLNLNQLYKRDLLVSLLKSSLFYQTLVSKKALASSDGNVNDLISYLINRGHSLTDSSSYTPGIQVRFFQPIFKILFHSNLISFF